MTDCTCGHPRAEHANNPALESLPCLFGMPAARGCDCPNYVEMPPQISERDLADLAAMSVPDERTAYVQLDAPNRMLPESATVACIWVKRDADTLALEFDAIDDRVPPERRALALVLRDLADALDAQAAEMGE